MANEAVWATLVDPIVWNTSIWSILCLVLGRLGNRLLRYFKDCWSECQPNTPHFDDDDPDESICRDNPLKRRLHESTSTTITRDKNNNTRPRKNYRQLAGLSDDDDDDNEAEYVPLPSVKRARHSTAPVPIYITMDPDSPAFIVYHDHSYFIRHESTNNSLNSSVDQTHRRKSSLPAAKTVEKQPPTQSCLPSVQVLNRLLLEHQQKKRNSPSDSTVQPGTSTTSNLDFSAILRALLAKQGHSQTMLDKGRNDPPDTMATAVSATMVDPPVPADSSAASTWT